MYKRELENVLRDLEETVSGASRVPLTGKILVDGDVVLEYVDKIYATLPEEIRQARDVLNQSDKLLENVEGQGKRILEDARTHAMRMVEESEVMKEAHLKAAELMDQAEKAAQELHHQSIMYSDDVLMQLEMNLEKIIYSIKQSRDELKDHYQHKNKKTL